jgi:hypothetical protein
MYNNIHRDSEYINCLKDFIHKKYHINAIAITPAKRGYYGETWQLETVNNLYFIKLDYFPRHQKLFQNSLSVVEYLCNNGIDFINKIVKTYNGELYSIFNSAVLGVFEWIDGENIETDDTKIPEYQMLCKIYPLTKQGFDIPTVEFSDDMAIRFYEKWEKLKDAPLNEANDAVHSIFEHHSEKLSHCALRLSHFASLCQKNKADFYITHGDAGGNFFVGNGRHYFVDWDEVMYAPLERDAWVMCCRDWARKLFNDTLRENNIQYTLRPERLAFYCYHMFFHYLGEFLEDFMLHSKSKRIEDYFDDGWIEERIQFADKI